MIRTGLEMLMTNFARTTNFKYTYFNGIVEMLIWDYLIVLQFLSREWRSFKVRNEEVLKSGMKTVFNVVIFDLVFFFYCYYIFIYLD